MGQIVLLDDLTINKIAAGEVVDRPASIVKELVENSIDAKATNIVVEIKNGGISYIRITDNGTGMHQDDVELAFERHATSKIRKEEDIITVRSMGFRGEALASVAAIANVEVTTKHKDENIGSKIVVEAGKILEFAEAASPVGTTIKVRNVFFNVPARYKFLKKDYTEAGYIEDVIKRIALVHPEISFRYINNGKTIISTTGNGDVKTCIYNIFGKTHANNIINVETEMDDIKVEGVIGTQELSRATRTQQFFYVNKRYIKDKILSSAVENGYVQNIAIGKYPFCVLNISVNPTFVDVNVHPAKLEVKFENESKIFSVVTNAVKNAIYRYNIENSPFKQAPEVETVKEENNEQEENLESTANYVAKEIILSKIKRSEEEKPTYENISFFNKIKEDYSDNFTKEPQQTAEKSLEEEEESYAPEVVQTVENTEEKTVPKEDIVYKYRGVIFNTYPIVEIGEKVYIVDQHAAHERLLFEKVKEIYYSKEKTTQMLLLPILVELSNKEMSIYLNNKKVFEDIGFVISEFGDSAVKIEGVPNLSYDIDHKSMFLDILDELMGADGTNRQEKEFRFLATVACKAAVKGNNILKEEEYKTLIDNMMKLDKPFTCPHGRPTAYELSKYEIERRFLRK